MTQIIKDHNYISLQIKKKNSMLCVGLDPDLSKLEDRFLNTSTPLQSFCTEIINATHDLAIAYKLNVAFFESFGPKGWEQLAEVVHSIPNDCLIILDAKRADIGNTSAQYARYYFEDLKVDAVTLHPYMGLDSIAPFLSYANKWSVVLALTSNEGSNDIEQKRLDSGIKVYEHILELYSKNYNSNQIMFVCGATHPEEFKSIRKIVPDHFLLVPGIGAQGGNLKSVIENGANASGGLLINVSRAISYPSGNGNYTSLVRKAAEFYQQEMSLFL